MKYFEYNLFIFLIFTTNFVLQITSDTDTYRPYDGPMLDKFDWKLFKILAQEEKSNLFVSTFSIKVILSLLFEAAVPNRNNLTHLSTTAQELSQILAGNSLKAFDDHNSQVFQSIKTKQDNYEIKVGTKVFSRPNFVVNPNYLSLVKELYDSGVGRLDINEINSWVSQVTNGHIPELFEPNTSLLDDAVLVLVNAIFFKGKWLHQFEEFLTQRSTFYTSSTKNTETYFMTTTEYFFYHESTDLNCQVVRLPYKGNRYSMMVLLPNETSNVDTLTNQLSSESLQKVRKSLKNNNKILINLPKFEFTHEVSLNEPIEKCGIKQIFTEQAKFPHLSESDQIFVSKILQKAGIKVDEEGSTAFAATGGIIDIRFEPEAVEFNANRPFIFFIEDERTGALLFAGKFVKP
uniref:Putative salivary serpin n=1 Tax=Corethrella appendiculata TaxID=1370023 RepID=U5EW77_9DIPT